MSTLESLLIVKSEKNQDFQHLFFETIKLKRLIAEKNIMGPKYTDAFTLTLKCQVKFKLWMLFQGRPTVVNKAACQAWNSFALPSSVSAPIARSITDGLNGLDVIRGVLYCTCKMCTQQWCHSILTNTLQCKNNQRVLTWNDSNMRGSKQKFPTCFHKSISIPLKNENVLFQEKREDCWKK